MTGGPGPREATCACGATIVAGDGFGAGKCPTCRTFPRDHRWYGSYDDPSDNANPRCWDCDTRHGSHGGPGHGR